MKRKVIQLASNTLVVSLPAKWVKKTALRKGHELEVDESGDVLLLSRAGSKDAPFSVRLDAGKVTFSKNMLSYLYQKGYSTIELVNIDPKTMSDVRRKVSDLIGWEIVDHSERGCTVRAVSREIDAEFDNMLRRSFLITLEMGRDIQDAISRKEFDRMESIRSLEKTTNIFTDFCKRVLSMGSYSDPRNTVYMYVIVRDLEKIGDFYKRICDVVLGARTPPKISKKVQNLIAEANSYFNMFYELFYRYDPVAYEKFINEGKEIIDAAGKLMRNTAPEECLVLHELMSLVTATYEMSGPYFILNYECIAKSS